MADINSAVLANYGLNELCEPSSERPYWHTILYSEQWENTSIDLATPLATFLIGRGYLLADLVEAEDHEDHRLELQFYNSHNIVLAIGGQRGAVNLLLQAYRMMGGKVNDERNESAEDEPAPVPEEQDD